MVSPDSRLQRRSDKARGVGGEKIVVWLFVVVVLDEVE